jgi:hypothetical protein
MMRGLLTLIGVTLIVVPEPITTVVGAMTLFFVLRFGGYRRHRFVNSSGVIVRNGKLS